MTMQSSGSAAPANAGATAASAVAPSVTLVTATALAVADMVGIGVFTSLGFQVKDLPSGLSLVLLWTVGGIMALCGALSYAELAAAFPRSGGEYNFLSRIYHQALGFMAGWVSATVGFAAPVALAAMAFGKYFQGVFSAGSPVLLSFAAVWIIALFHLRNLKLGSAFQNFSTVLKLLLIGAIISAGVFHFTNPELSFLPTRSDIAPIFATPFAVGLVYVMYSYSGWNASAYIISEVRRPERNVPRSLLCGTLVVIAI